MLDCLKNCGSSILLMYFAIALGAISASGRGAPANLEAWVLVFTLTIPSERTKTVAAS